MSAVTIEFPEALRRFGDASKEFKSGFFDRLRTYTRYIVQYVKREKLSGQVLGKYRNIYNLAQGQARWRREPGTLKATFGANAYNLPDPSIQFRETIYGAAWEKERYTRKAYTVRPLAWRNPKTARLVFYLGGRWIFAKKVHIPALSMPGKPHIRPSIYEPEPKKRFATLLFRLFMRYITGGRS